MKARDMVPGVYYDHPAYGHMFPTEAKGMVTRTAAGDYVAVRTLAGVPYYINAEDEVTEVEL